MLDTRTNDQASEAPATFDQEQPPVAPEATPAPPTVPLRADEEPASSSVLPSAPNYDTGYGAGYNSAFDGGYGATPPPPYTYWSPATPPQRPGRNLRGALIAVALLIALAIGGGAGALLTLRTVNGATTSGSTIVLGAKSAPAITISSSTTSLQQSVETVAKAVEPSVVEITSTGSGQNGESIGSGDILTSNGYIVTNDHVVQGFSTFTVTLSNGSSKQAQLIGQDAQDDLAVLKINATGLTPIAIGDSSKATVGEFNIAVGSPLGLQNSATFGIVSALNRSASEAPTGPAGALTGLIQTSAPFNPGNSGGALVNLQGQLIGIPTLSATNPETNSSANSIGYAIPSNRVEYVAQQLIAHGSLTRTGQGFIGIQAEDVTPQLAAANGLSVQSGVLVASFANDAAGQSPAQQAGVKVGDVITAINGQTVTTNSDLSSALLNDAPGAKVTLTITRGSSQSAVTVALGERPVSAG
ncbi:MAG TPA: trypsin-like peptidase domain-containing protein [Ktedonobacterales bacterium]|jgi:S1-C subfamily serine protease|nr:trypsin-like peptidase domain-containing protein [Ktedonobacterales bacterium]